MKWFVACYWIPLSVAVVGLSADGSSSPWQTVLVIAWLLVWRFRRQIRRLLSGRVRVRQQGPAEGPTAVDGSLSPPSSPPLWVWYFGLGLLYTTVIGEALGIALEGDIHPNLAINTFLWVGSYLGLLGGWWLPGTRLNRGADCPVRSPVWHAEMVASRV